MVCSKTGKLSDRDRLRFGMWSDFWDETIQLLSFGGFGVIFNDQHDQPYKRGLLQTPNL